jgi:site-specific DNA recombinase
MTAPSHSTPHRAVAYVRVDMEHEDGISPDLQIRAIREYCAPRGITITHVIEDLDLSGRFWKTRRIDEAISLIEAGQTDALVVWRWSRVSRDRYDWAFAVARVETAGGQLISATEDFDTTRSVGRLIRGILAEFAAFESDRIGDLWRDSPAAG